MKLFTSRILSTAVLGAALIIPATMHAEDRDHPKSYHHKGGNDEHEWNAHEDKAYRIWAKENHRKYRDFAKLKEEEREDYWRWRHDHSDALLKIDIR